MLLVCTKLIICDFFFLITIFKSGITITLDQERLEAFFILLDLAVKFEEYYHHDFNNFLMKVECVYYLDLVLCFL